MTPPELAQLQHIPKVRRSGAESPDRFPHLRISGVLPQSLLCWIRSFPETRQGSLFESGGHNNDKKHSTTEMNREAEAY